jgi:5-deoxy-glucuronate isomerase
VIELSGQSVTTLLVPSGNARIGVARARGPVCATTREALAWLVVEGGSGTLQLGRETVPVEGRSDVFAGAGWSAMIGRDRAVAVDGDLHTTLGWCSADRDVESRFIDPADVPEEARGSGTTARRVRTYASEGPLIAGETLNPPGGWSSWPPHSHAHEEIYLYRFDPDYGFGLHADLSADGEGPRVVRDGDIVRIVGGQHPVVAAPGCAMYYLWALAGDTDTVDTAVDDRFS